MISGNWRRADIGTDVGKDEIHDKSANWSENWCWADVVFSTWIIISAKLTSGPTSGQMSEKMTFVQNKSANWSENWCWANVAYFDLIIILQNWRRADIGPILGKMAFITSRQTVRKLMLGRCCYFDMNYDIGKLTSGRHRDRCRKRWNSWTSWLTDYKIDVGPTLLFRPELWYRKTDVGPTSGKCQKRWHSKQVGKLIRILMLGQRRYFDLIMISQNWRRADMLGKMAFITSRQTGQKTDVGPTLFFGPELWYREIDVGPDIWPDVWKDEIHDKLANDQKIDVGPMLLFRPDYDVAKIMSGWHLGQCRKRWHSKQVGKLSES